MKKTWETRVHSDGHVYPSVVDLTPFADQQVTITVETAEKEKPKVKMCDAFVFDDGNVCHEPAQWEIVSDGCKHYRCDNHIYRVLHNFRTEYTITPIPPQPEPVVVEWEEGFRHSYPAVINVPEELCNKCFVVRFEEKRHPERLK